MRLTSPRASFGSATHSTFHWSPSSTSRDSCPECSRNTAASSGTAQRCYSLTPRPQYPRLPLSYVRPTAGLTSPCAAKIWEQIASSLGLQLKSPSWVPKALPRSFSGRKSTLLQTKLLVAKSLSSLTEKLLPTRMSPPVGDWSTTSSIPPKLDAICQWLSKLCIPSANYGRQRSTD